MPLYLDKPLGLTPLDLLDSLPKPPGKKYSFAGRLDPMARGKMIILEDEECQKQDSFCGMDKIYEFSILYGFQTDTYDILGLLQNNTNSYHLEEIKKNIDTLNLSYYQGSLEQPYPSYSSIKVNKHPLWWWAKNNRLDEISIPSKKVKIYNIECIKPMEVYNSYDLLNQIKEKIYCLPVKRRQHFRVPEIMDCWHKKLLENTNEWVVGHYRAEVSSGTYIRSLVNQIGNDLGIGAIAFDIYRTNFLDKKNIR